MEHDSNRLMNEAAVQQQAQLKQRAGKAVVDDMVKSGMKLGLGTGSTAIHAVRRVGELLAQGTLCDISIFATSFQTEIECEKLKIPVYTLNSPQLSGGLALTIDGADEVDPQNRLIKGGGGAMLIEKIAAYSSSSFAIIVDESKIVENLGLAFPVPIEVVPEARVQVIRHLISNGYLTSIGCLDKFGVTVMLREALRKAGPVITEHGNLILDVRFSSPVDPVIMETELNKIPGVVENGFFTGNPPVVYIAHSDNSIEIRGKA
jgi:ribose 5-phosphate isomerase A